MGSRWMALGGLGLVVGSVVLAPAVRAGTAQSSCAQPYPAWFVDDDISPPDPEGPSLEASLEHPVLGSRPDGSGLDTDLDGATDVVAWEGGTLVLERGDGVVRLEPPAGLTPVDGTSLNVGLGTAEGDLDGDGAPEFSVSVEGASEFMFFLVLGTVTPGTHPVDAVSVDVTLAGGGGVGDQDGDGIDDAIAGAGESGGPTSIVRGLDIVAPGAGGVLTEVPPAIRTIPTPVDGVLDLVDGAPVLASADPFADAERVLLYLPEETVELAVPSTGYELGATGSVTANLYRGDRIIVLRQGWRNGGRSVMWNLDAPCTTFAADAAPGPTPAVPAEPAAGASSYTG